MYVAQRVSKLSNRETDAKGEAVEEAAGAEVMRQGQR